MKYPLLFIATFFASLFCAQNTFEYERTWGTYFGPAPSQMAGNDNTFGILFDTQKNMHMRGNIITSTNPAAYFNQFLVGGGDNYPAGSSAAHFQTVFSPQGIPSFYGYQDPSNYKRLEAIDYQDNKYYIFYGASPAIQATAGTFMPTDPQPASAYKVLLAKYSPTGALLWATYLPSVTNGTQVCTDATGNIYISHETTLSQNVATSGVWQENYDFIYTATGDLIPNGYLVKLDSNGQRIWGTYLPGGAGEMRYYSGSLYILSGANTNPNLNTMATPGAFQTTVASQTITKMDAATGNRQWGTYYGSNPATNLEEFSGIEVNSTGIYITGTDYNYDNSYYFGTPGSYRPQVSGDSDIFLSKFSLSGAREWSTYFGHSGGDTNIFDKVLALNGNDIYITGAAYGVGNNIATPGSYQTAPEQSLSNGINFYFAKFNATGSLIWCSYYGGTSVFPGWLVPINVAFDNNVLFLFGSTNSNTGYATEGAWMPVRNPANTNEMTSFIARFDNKNMMGTTEADAVKDLVLYNNPNNGNFSISGNILQKEPCTLLIYDAAGRLVRSEKLNRNKVQHFSLQGLLAKGNYLVEVKGAKQQQLKVFKMVVNR